MSVGGGTGEEIREKRGGTWVMGKKKKKKKRKKKRERGTGTRNRGRGSGKRKMRKNGILGVVKKIK
jgi:hypothetical protein